MHVTNFAGTFSIGFDGNTFNQHNMSRNMFTVEFSDSSDDSSSIEEIKTVKTVQIMEEISDSEEIVSVSPPKKAPKPVQKQVEPESSSYEYEEEQPNSTVEAKLSHPPEEIRPIRAVTNSVDVPVPTVVVSPTPKVQNFRIVVRRTSIRIYEPGTETALLVAGTVNDIMGKSYAICSAKPIGRFYDTNRANLRFHQRSKRLTLVRNAPDNGCTREPQLFGMASNKRSLTVVFKKDYMVTNKYDDLSRVAQSRADISGLHMLISQENTTQNDFGEDCISDKRNTVLVAKGSNMTHFKLYKCAKKEYCVKVFEEYELIEIFGLALACMNISLS